MKKFLLICLMSIASIQAYSQEKQKPDLEAIKKAVQDTAYYNNLKRQFFNFKTLTPTDLANLFYGQMFLEDYSPYDKVMWIPKIEEIEKQKGTKTALYACIMMLEKRPAYLPLLDYTIYMADKAELDKELVTAMLKNKVLLLLEIFKTGTGESTESPFIVVSPSDERLLLQVLRIESTTQHLIEENGRHYDMREVTPNDKFKADKAYFDITIPYAKLGDMLESKQ